MSKDRITLTVPAQGEYARTVRVTAAELASRLGMSYDEVDDVRLAAEEAFVYGCEAVGEEGDISFTFIIEEGSLTVEVGPMACRMPEDGSSASDNYAEFILKSVCDEFAIEHDADSCLLRLCHRATAPGSAGA